MTDHKPGLVVYPVEPLRPRPRPPLPRHTPGMLGVHLGIAAAILFLMLGFGQFLLGMGDPFAIFVGVLVSVLIFVWLRLDDLDRWALRTLSERTPR